MSIRRAVKEGYKENSWVYRSIFLKSKAAGAVAWSIVDGEGTKLPDHRLTTLINRPNPFVSKQELFELITSWLELSGNSYLKRADSNGLTQELWPVSPDRLRPVPTTDVEKWVEGYNLDNKKRPGGGPEITYQPEEVIHHKYLNPANPIIGIGPLEVLSKTVDVDNEQRNFNMRTTQNRGVVDGVFMFKRKFSSLSESDAVSDRINEKFGGKRSFGVLGNEASYQRVALTPAEMDFIQSRRSNREEIFICFGVPPVYAGVMEAATFNNYRTSELTFWFGTMLFLLDDLRDTLNFAFAEELRPGERFAYDISNIQAIREAMLDRTEVAQQLYDMGVPFDQLNRVFELGFEEFPGWGDPNPRRARETVTTPTEERESNSVKTEKRQQSKPIEFRISGEALRDAIEENANDNQGVIADLFQTQQDAVFEALNNNIDTDVRAVLDNSVDLFMDRLNTFYVQTGVMFGQQTEVETRQSVEELTAEIENYLDEERVLLNEVANINATTAEKIVNQVRSALESGANISTLQQAIIDTGILSEVRALGLARTISANAANLGQLRSAALNGANEKTWITAASDVRETHQDLDQVTISLNDTFNVGGTRAEYPAANNLPPAERMN